MYNNICYPKEEQEGNVDIMLQWIKGWIVRQNERSQRYRQWALDKNTKRQGKLQARADAHLETMLNGSGSKKQVARRCMVIYKNLYPCYKVDYIGGHYADPQGHENIPVMFIPEHGLLVGKTLDIIPISDIKSVGFKTKEQIDKDVTLTRLIAFGWYAFALKKKRKTITRYLVVNCEKNGMPYSLAFAGEGVGKLYTVIFQKLAG